MIGRLWNSPTFATWASFGARALTFVAVLPLVLTRFTPAEVALWQVFAALVSLQLVVDMGFAASFVRIVSYAMAGVSDATRGIEPDWDCIRRLAGTIRVVYRWLAVLFALILAIGGTLALIQRVSALSEPTAVLPVSGHTPASETDGWIAWGIVVGTSWLGFRGSGWTAFLQGMNRVALVRRWEAIFAIGTIATNIAVLLAGGGLLALVISNQCWAVVSYWRNRAMVAREAGERLGALGKLEWDRTTFREVWAPAWRSGLGAAMSMGLTQVSAVLYAQSRDSVAVASYLLGLRLIQATSQLSQAPFYSKLPVFAQLWSRSKRDEIVALAGRGLTLSYWSFVVPFVVLGLAGPWLVSCLGSHTPFPDPTLWALLGLAVLAERYGAMHLQLYSTTNHILWHYANGVSGAVFVVTSLLLFPRFQVLALPLGMLAGNLGFYAWFSARLSHREFRMPWPAFDLRTAGGPALCLFAYLAYARYA